jgi:hypothetical protein
MQIQRDLEHKMKPCSHTGVPRTAQHSGFSPITESSPTLHPDDPCLHTCNICWRKRNKYVHYSIAEPQKQNNTHYRENDTEKRGNRVSETPQCCDQFWVARHRMDYRVVDVRQINAVHQVVHPQERCKHKPKHIRARVLSCPHGRPQAFNITICRRRKSLTSMSSQRMPTRINPQGTI